MKKINYIITLILLTGNMFASETWDIINKSMVAWNVNGSSNTDKAWIFSKSASGSIPTSAVTQESGYVNVMKTFTNIGFNYGFLVPAALTLSSNTAYTFEVKARIKPIDKVSFPDITPPLTGEGGFESNQISARMNNKNMSIHLKYGDANVGYITLQAGVSHSNEEKFKLNTSEWHIYRFVFYADNLKYDVYVDGSDNPIFENAPTTSMSGTNILRLGAETNNRCNMDIEYAKMGIGDFSSKPKINSVSLSSDSHVVNHERTVSLTVSTALINIGEKLIISFVDKNGVNVLSPTEITIASNNTISNFTIPATVPVGEYNINITAPNGTVGDIAVNPKNIQYVVVEESPIDSKILPQVKLVGFMTKIEDYLYKAPSNEFIFPSIIDAKKYTINGKFQNGQDTLARYYRFYTPHENPGGMFLATSSSLDGPWTEHNTVINLSWAKAVPNNIINTATHISACQVIWNEIFHKYFMYFHGPNTTTHYATSDNLIDWTFGGSILEAKQFSSTGSEASYAKVFEHEIPGLGNKYVMILMIMENIRSIYWAYSNDGVNWTPVKKPLVSSDLNYKKIPGTDVKPNYTGSMGSNISGPFFMEKNGRCFVFCHGSSGNICVVEVGQSFDMEVHWGEYLKASDVVIDTDNNGNPIAVPRIAAPVFIQNDAGKWYMFIEAGTRLGANIAYAKEEDDHSTNLSSQNMISSTVSIYPTLLKRGQQITIKSKYSINLRVEIFNTLGKKLYSSNFNNKTDKIEIPYSRGVYFVKTTIEDNSVSVASIIVTD